MEKVGVNTFVTRQIKGSGKTYSDKLTFNEIALDAQSQMAKKSYVDGYRDGVRIVQASKKNIKHFHCPFVKINSNTQLISRVVKRQDNEESYIQTRAVTGKQLQAEIDRVITKSAYDIEKVIPHVSRFICGAIAYFTSDILDVSISHASSCGTERVSR